jgi:hypothetical protein
MSKHFALAAGLLLSFSAAADDDLRDYAQANLDTQSRAVAIEAVIVEHGIARLRSQACVPRARRTAIKKALLARREITAVHWHAPPCAAAESVAETDYAQTDEGGGLLPEGELFAPLLADPRQPQFGLAYQAHQTSAANLNTMLIEMGQYFPFFRGDLGAGRFEIGAQAGVFALFNLDSNSFELINTDFVGGLPISYRLGRFSARAQVYHQSSHLGDEFLISNPNVKRINLSYEDADLLLAYEFFGFRLYGGGGYIFRSKPDLDPAHWQGGLEFRWPHLFAGLDLVAAGDFQGFEKQNWEIDQSYALGLAYRRDDTREIRLMAEYFDGFSPNGQFYRSRLEYTGVGLYFDF